MSTDLKAILFDLDGIIVDSEPIYDELFKHRMRDLDIILDDYAEVLGGTWKVVFEMVNKKFNTQLDTELESNLMADKIVEYNMDRGIRLKSGIKEFISNVAEQYTLAVVSSSHCKVVENILLHNRLEQYFATLITYEDIIYPKPHPQPYQLAMERLTVTPEESIVIEDSLNGVKSGFAAGAFVYALPDPRMAVEDYIPFSKVVYNFEDIAQDIL